MKRRRPDFHRLFSALLVVSIAAAAGGILSGGPPGVLIAGAALALFIWEFTGSLDHRRVGFPGHFHTALLAASVGAGLLVAEAGLFIRLPLPFAGVLLAGGITLFGLVRFSRSFRIPRK